jgi:hypothetical protein
LAVAAKSENLSVTRTVTFFYTNIGLPKRLMSLVFACLYGYLPGIYLSVANSLRRVFGRPPMTSVPGCGVSADHLFVVLTHTDADDDRHGDL